MRVSVNHLRFIVTVLGFAFIVIMFQIFKMGSTNGPNIAYLPGEERRKIYLIGDSLTQKSFSPENLGWGAGLADWYQRSTDVINRGFSGYNSFWVSHVVPHIILPRYNQFYLPIPRKDIILAIILLGSNDSVFSDQPQHVEVARFEQNIKEIIRYLRSLDSNMNIILITPPPVDDSKLATRNNNSVNNYAQSIRKLASHLNTGLVDLWSGETLISPDDLIDGLHFNEKGNRKVLMGVKSAISKYVPEIIPVGLGLHYPHCSFLKSLSDDEAETAIRNWRWLN